MTAKTAMVDEYAFAAEGLAGTACSAALRRVQTLARFTPTSRAITAIATLTEYAGRIESGLLASERALAVGDEAAAAAALDDAVVLMDQMTVSALPNKDRGRALARSRSGSAA